MKLGYTVPQMGAGLRKYVALFILLWAFADLTVPNLCHADETSEIAAGLLAAYSGSATGLQGEVHAVSEQPQSPLKGSGYAPEDCFCCCWHIAPAPVFAIFYPFSTEFYHPARLAHSVTLFPSNLYHPPRF